MFEIGDKIKLVKWPEEFDVEGYYLDEDTRAFYETILKEGTMLAVDDISEGVSCASVKIGDDTHSILVNHSGFVKVG